jgi:hypothetical protein
MQNTARIRSDVQTQALDVMRPVSLLQSGESVQEWQLQIFLFTRNSNHYDKEKIYPHSMAPNTGAKTGSRNISNAEICFFKRIDDAIERYKILNNDAKFDTALAEPFFSAFRSRCHLAMPRFTLYPDGAKARFIFNEKEFVVDFDYEEPEPVYVSAYKGEVLVFKKCMLAELQEMLENF